MRIICGSRRGKKIIAPENLPVRPTTDFAKESIFNILNNYFNLLIMLYSKLYLSKYLHMSPAPIVTTISPFSATFDT